MADKLPESHDQNHLLIYSLRQLENNNKNTKTEKLKKQLDEGFQLNFPNMRCDPNRYVELKRSNKENYFSWIDFFKQRILNFSPIIF